MREQELLLNEVGEIAKIGGWEIDLITGSPKCTKAVYNILEIEHDQPPPGLKKHIDSYLPEYRPMVQGAFDSLREKGRPFEYEARIKTPNGNIKWCRVIGRAENKNGKCARLYGIIQDITERKRIEKENADLEDQLRRAQKLEAIGTLAGGIAHDFNNILSAQLGYTDLALLEAHGNPKLEVSLQKARQASQRATSLVKQILSFSRRTEHEQRPTHMGPVIKEAMDLIRASIPTSIEIVTKIDDEDQTIMANATQIHQVVLNLCTNAAYAMKENGGVLEVSLDTVTIGPNPSTGLEDINPGEYQRLSVKDTGHGMDAKTLERIFDPFFTSKGEGKGTGLGLSVVYGIVKDHGGTIKVYSRKDKGTEFHIYFPLIDGKVQALDDSPPKGPIPAGRERVLLVDDEEMLVEVTGVILERLGYKVTGCTSSSKALELLTSAPEDYDILVTDYTMPKMTGDILVEKVLAIKPGLPIIMCTGFSDKMDSKKAQKIGIGKLLMKPFSERALATALRTLLDQAKDGPSPNGAEG